MLKGLKNIYDWYLILTFPTTIFFQKSMRIIDTNLFFSGDFQGQEGERIMQP